MTPHFVNRSHHFQKLTKPLINYSHLCQVTKEYIYVSPMKQVDVEIHVSAYSNKLLFCFYYFRRS